MENVMHSDEVTALINKLDGQYISGVTDATPDTESSISHELGRIPKGYIVVSRDKAGIIYDGSTANTDELLYIQSDVASVAVKIYVF